MAENEEAFEVEARNEGLGTESGRIKKTGGRGDQIKGHSLDESMAEADEASPLIAQNLPTGQSAQSGDGADFVTEPWTAYADSPWYKRPSVTH